MFQALYDKTLSWAQHKHAKRYLSLISFADSSVCPISPLVMLVPMALAQPNKAYSFALRTTLFSALGAILGYCIGYFLFEAISPWLETTHYWENYLSAKSWVDEWGVWAVLIGGFLPIPYKIFTIAAGSVSMSLPLFLLISTLGRGARFCFVAFLLKIGGEKLETRLRHNINEIVWGVVGLLVLFGLYHFLKG
ncbi:MAG: YqaA family protein [Methylococcaceae bacterium]